MDRAAEVEFLRNALRRRVEQTSIRHVALEVRMSHGGIYNLILGKVEPYGKTLSKLRVWYMGRWAEGGESLSSSSAGFLLEEMLGSIPRALRGQASLELLDRIGELHRKHSVPVPGWVQELRVVLRAGLEQSDEPA